MTGRWKTLMAIGIVSLGVDVEALGQWSPPGPMAPGGQAQRSWQFQGPGFTISGSGSYPTPPPGGYQPSAPPGGFGPINPAMPSPSMPTPAFPNPAHPNPPAPPGGFVPGNPASPPFNPNGVAGASGSSTSYWDPHRGWVTHSQNSTVLNSATSPGRAPAPGAPIQHYNYWDGSQWVRGTRWLGQDGLWHGDHANTTVGPNGSQTDQQVYYFAGPGAGAQGGR